MRSLSSCSAEKSNSAGICGSEEFSIRSTPITSCGAKLKPECLAKDAATAWAEPRQAALCAGRKAVRNGDEGERDNCAVVPTCNRARNAFSGKKFHPNE